MAAALDVKTLCLGVLSHGPATGYDIRKYFERTFSHFYSAGYGSIYPALAELARDGAVTCEEQPQHGRPDRKVYALTETGRARFVAALITTEPSHRVRSEFLVLMHFAHLLPPERLAALLEERVAAFDRDLALLDTYAGDANFCAEYGRVVLRAARDFVAGYRARLTGTATDPLSSGQRLTRRTGT